MTKFTRLAGAAKYCDMIGCYEIADAIHVRLAQMGGGGWSAQMGSNQNFNDDRPMQSFADPTQATGAFTAFGNSVGVYDPNNPYQAPTTGMDHPLVMQPYTGHTMAEWQEYQQQASQFAQGMQGGSGLEFIAKQAKYYADNAYYKAISEGKTPDQAAQEATQVYYNSFNKPSALPPEIENMPTTAPVNPPGYASNDGFGN